MRQRHYQIDGRYQACNSHSVLRIFMHYNKLTNRMVQLYFYFLFWSSSSIKGMSTPLDIRSRDRTRDQENTKTLRPGHMSIGTNHWDMVRLILLLNYNSRNLWE